MRIGALTTGAGVVTTFAGQAQCDEYMVIGDVDTANPLQAVQVEVDGKTILNINSAALITAWMKYLVEANVGTNTIGLVLKISTGEITKSTTYRLTNAGATVPNIFVFSDSDLGVPLEVSSKTINANSVETFEKFTALFLETPANLNYVEVVFRREIIDSKTGKKTERLHSEQLAIEEVDALFSLTNQSEANGRLGTVSVIDNSNQTIKSVKVYTNGVGALTVLVGKIPNEAFKALKG